MTTVLQPDLEKTKIKNKPGPKPGSKRTAKNTQLSNYKVKTKKINLSNKRGRILIILDNLLSFNDINLLKLLFCKFYPYQIKQHEGVLQGMFEYSGYSEEFDLVKDEELIPLYEVIMEKDGIIFKKVIN